MFTVSLVVFNALFLAYVVGSPPVRLASGLDFPAGESVAAQCGLLQPLPVVIVANFEHLSHLSYLLIIRCDDRCLAVCSDTLVAV